MILPRRTMQVLAFPLDHKIDRSKHIKVAPVFTIETITAKICTNPQMALLNLIQHYKAHRRLG